MTYQQYQPYPIVQYSIGYALGLKSGDESIVVLERPYKAELLSQYGQKHVDSITDWDWKISYLFHWENRIDLYRLSRVIQKITKNNEKFYNEKCFTNQLDYFSYPDESDVLVLDTQYPEISRSFEVYCEEDSLISLCESSYHRGVDLLNHGVLQRKPGCQGNLKAFENLDKKKVDARHLALALASIYIGVKEEVEVFDSVLYSADLFQDFSN